MEQRTLLTMTDFVFKQMEENSFDDDKMMSIWAYAQFLKRPLELGFFVPCDENGNVLRYPKPENFFDVKIIADEFQELDKAGFYKYTVALMDFEQAKERVLFEDCVYDDEMEVVRSQDGENLCYIPQKELWKIEDLVKYNLTLSPSAIQQLKLK